jgi:DNA polymerase-3 subunit delta'
LSEIEQRKPDQLDGVPLPEMQRRVIGHEAARAGILAMLDARRLPGGVLVHGPHGIGKATLAFDLAREIFARTGDEQPSHIAEQVAAGGYPNLQVLRKAPRDSGKGYYTVIRVDEVRTVIERLHRTRGRAGHRVVIVDPIDDCNPSSANALLKILEEPPADTTFFLISHRPGSLLPTIRSRCHALALRPLADEQVREILLTAKPGENVDHAVELAGGRPRRGFEAMLVGDGSALAALGGWLGNPAQPPAAAHIALADVLAAERDGAQGRFAREMLRDWLAAEAKAAAEAGPPARRRLASATELWDKADLMFAEADEYNLDPRQTLVAIFDAIRKHALLTASPIEPR